MSRLFPSTLVALGMLFATSCAAQTETGAMPVTIDGAELMLAVSTTNLSALSERGESAPGFDQVTVVGFLENGETIDLQVYVTFGVLVMHGNQMITDPDIMVTERGTGGGWTTSGGAAPVITITTYVETDAGVLVEGTFSGAPDYRASLYSMPDGPGETRTVSGSFSIRYPAE